MTTNLRPGLRATRVTRTAVAPVAGCCRPDLCRPIIGVRCCASPRCSCVFPTTIGVAWRYAGERGPATTPERALERARTGAPAWVRPAGIAVGVAGGAGALGGLAWGVALAVAWVVEHALLIAGGFAGVAFLLAVLGGGGGSSRTFSGTFRGRMD